MKDEVRARTRVRTSRPLIRPLLSPVCPVLILLVSPRDFPQHPHDRIREIARGCCPEVEREGSPRPAVIWLQDLVHMWPFVIFAFSLRELPN